MPIQRPPLAGIWSRTVETGLAIACERICEYVNSPATEGTHGIAMPRMLFAVAPVDLQRLDEHLARSLETGEALDIASTSGSKLHGIPRVRARASRMRRSDRSA